MKLTDIFLVAPVCLARGTRWPPTVRHRGWSFLRLVGMSTLALMLVSLPAPGSDDDATGRIVIEGEPGTQLFLDEEHVGFIVEGSCGTVLRASPGLHEIRQELAGYLPDTVDVYVDEGDWLQIPARSFLSNLRIQVQESGDSTMLPLTVSTGCLLVQSLPSDCEISLPDLRVLHSKTQGKWLATNIPPGSYLVEFTHSEYRLVHSAVITAGDTLSLLVDFLDEEVIEDVVSN